MFEIKNPKTQCSLREYGSILLLLQDWEFIKTQNHRTEKSISSIDYIQGTAFIHTEEPITIWEKTCVEQIPARAGIQKVWGIRLGDNKHFLHSCYVINWHACLRGLFCTVKLTMLTPLWTCQPSHFYGRNTSIMVLLEETLLSCRGMVLLAISQERHVAPLGWMLEILPCLVWYIALFPAQEPSCPKDNCRALEEHG